MKFKQFETVPAYVYKPLSFIQRKYLSKLRGGSLGIRIESGRFARPRLEVHERVCLVCSDSRIQEGLDPEIESEIHFLFQCGGYAQVRNCWFQNLTKPDKFESLDADTKLNIVLNYPENTKITAQFIVDAYSVRSKLINK